MVSASRSWTLPDGLKYTVPFTVAGLPTIPKDLQASWILHQCGQRSLPILQNQMEPTIAVLDFGFKSCGSSFPEI